MNTQYLRYPVAALLAVTVTLALFLFMQKLISSGAGIRGELEAIVGIHFGPVEIPDEIIARSRRLPKPPPPLQNQPPPPKMRINRSEQPAQNMPVMDMPSLDVPLVSGEGMFLGNFQQLDENSEGDIIPIVVIRPMYPRDAAIAGIEGWVKVEFTITEAGTVENPRVVDARPARIFNREAIRAILKWKFKPRVIDGVAVERQASQVIDFTLAEEGPH